MVEYLISTGLFIDRIFAFEIIVAWVCCLRTGEHAIDSGNHIHTTSTVYWNSCSRPFPNLKELNIKIKTSKNWRLGVTLHLQETQRSPEFLTTFYLL